MIVGWAAVAWASTWAMQERLVTEVRPPFGRWSATSATVKWLVDWDGDALRATMCSMVQDPVMGAVSAWPAGYRPSFAHPVRFDGTTFSMGPVTEAVGADDDDRDGNPGISVTVSHPRVGEGVVYVSQVATMAWAGTLGPDGRIRGRLDYEARQTFLGASTWWLRIPVPQRPAPGSTFELAPLPDGSGCDAVGGVAW